MNLKIADFGFVSYKNIDNLSTFRGTKTYMAPEIREGRVYKGRKVDLFSLGVILFIIVRGTFPFNEAKIDDHFYRSIVKGDQEAYFDKVDSTKLSENFKDLIFKLLAYDSDQRPNIDEIRAHEWLNDPDYSPRMIR